MTNNIETSKLFEIRGFYEEAFRFFDQTSDSPEVDVRFYSYIGVNHTIRIRKGIVYVRISDLCREMPALGQKALAYILVAKLRRKKVPQKAQVIYSRLSSTDEIREQASASRKTRGRKIITPAKGATYDLDEIFDSINRTYFQNAIPRPVLSWSAHKTYHRLGHYSADHNTIVISKSLDDPGVPRYVVDSVMHHEMLHIYHPTKVINGRRYSHTPAFRRDEAKFLYFNESENWIRKNARGLKIRAKSQHRPR
jgi:SprT-like family